MLCGKKGEALSSKQFRYFQCAHTVERTKLTEHSVSNCIEQSAELFHDRVRMQLVPKTFPISKILEVVLVYRVLHLLPQIRMFCAVSQNNQHLEK